MYMVASAVGDTSANFIQTKDETRWHGGSIQISISSLLKQQKHPFLDSSTIYTTYNEF